MPGAPDSRCSCPGAAANSSRSTSPDMPDGLEKIAIDMENLNMQELNNLWGTIGAKYVPSVVYRLKTVALGGNYSYYQPYVIRLPENSELGLL